MSIIKELFNGEIYPFEMISCTKESIEAEKMLNNYLKTVDENCPKQEGEYLSDKIRFQISEIQNLTAEQAFEIGFIIGVKLTAESFCTKTH